MVKFASVMLAYFLHRLFIESMRCLPHDVVSTIWYLQLAWTPAIMGGAIGGCGGVGGSMSPHFWDLEVQGVQGRGPMKMIFASTADSFYSVLYK